MILLIKIAMFASSKSRSQLRNEHVYCITEMKVDSGTISDAILTLISIKVLN